MSTASILVTILLWAAFGLQHSLLAQRWTKDHVARLLGREFVDYGYRFCYFLSQCVIYPAFWYVVSHLEPGRVLWEVPQVLYPLVHIVQIASHYILLMAVLFADVNSFIGTKLLYAYIRARLGGRPLPPVTLFGDGQLVVSHIFKLVRHPMYLGIILALASSTSAISEKVVLNLVCLLAYTYIGIYFEERQLVRVFGDAYVRYQCQVPKLMPFVRPRGGVPLLSSSGSTSTAQEQWHRRQRSAG